MESEEASKKMGMKVDIPSHDENDHMVLVGSGGGGGGGGLQRQSSITKATNCLCSPTTHAGSFRCRLHRTPPTLQRTKSIESEANRDPTSRPNTHSHF